jgi:nucleoid-associated protein YgaU
MDGPMRTRLALALLAVGLVASARADDPPTRRERPSAGGPSIGQLQRHVVREGEDLTSIARHYYGSERHRQALWNANRDRIASPERLPVGTVLRIPTEETLIRMARDAARPDRLAGRPVATLDTSVRRAGLEATAAPKPPRDAATRGQGGEGPVHVVGPFESLRSIARDRLGSSKRAAEILEINRDVLRAGDRITPGQYLRLPADAR